MDRTQKAEAVKGLNGLFADAGAVIVAHYSGMTVAQMGELRSRLEKPAPRSKWPRTVLPCVRLKERTQQGISELFKGPTGIAYSADPIAAPKVLVAYAKENDKFKILGGFAVGSVLDPEGVKALAELPSLDQLRGKILGLLQAPATKIAGILQAPAGQLARVVGAYAKKEAA
jgi:large subunit ribosomal protein L10